MAQYWGLKAIGKAIGLENGQTVLEWYYKRGLPMLLRRKGFNARRIWWSCDIMLSPWLMQMAQEQRKERLVMREQRTMKRARKSARSERVAGPHEIGTDIDVALAPKGHTDNATISHTCTQEASSEPTQPQDVVGDREPGGGGFTPDVPESAG